MDLQPSQKKPSITHPPLKLMQKIHEKYHSMQRGRPRLAAHRHSLRRGHTKPHKTGQIKGVLRLGKILGLRHRVINLRQTVLIQRSMHIRLRRNTQSLKRYHHGHRRQRHQTRNIEKTQATCTITQK